jgi:hypothetical protein
LTYITAQESDWRPPHSVVEIADCDVKKWIPLSMMGDRRQAVIVGSVSTDHSFSDFCHSSRSRAMACGVGKSACE